MRPPKRRITRGNGFSIEDTDWGMLDIMSEIDDMTDNTYITVGVHTDVPPYPNGRAVAFVYGMQEMGTRAGTIPKIPARPTLAPTFDKNRSKWIGETENIINDCLLGYRTLKQGVRRLGTMQMLAVKKAIADLKTPPNAPLTIKLKGKDDPLIHRRRLLKAINYKINGGRLGKG